MESDRWLGVELRHFLALEAVSREGSFGKAAQALGYTQSAVSQQIATLERLVGQKLVERPGGPKPVSLTEAGQLLLTHAEAIASIRGGIFGSSITRVASSFSSIVSRGTSATPTPAATSACTVWL